MQWLQGDFPQHASNESIKTFQLFFVIQFCLNAASVEILPALCIALYTRQSSIVNATIPCASDESDLANNRGKT